MPHARPTRILAALLLVLTVAAGVGASARGTGHTTKEGPAAPVTLHAVAHDTSAPLHATARGPLSLRIHAPMLNEWRERVQTTSAPVTDPIVQRSPGSTSMPVTSTNFDGLALQDAGGANYLPPDPTGDVGKTQFVQAVNGMVAVYTKTGTRIAGPIPNLDFWSGLGGHCDTMASGDPTVVYDSYADRWVYTEFAFDFNADGDPVAPYYQCVAVSTSGDATGTWNRYEFVMNTTLFPDYPKIAVWPDGYYMSVNQFDDLGFHGAGAVVFERSQMLTGAAAQAQYIDLSTVNASLGGILPADADGTTAPAAGSPAPFVGLIDDTNYSSLDRLQVWNFHVDWATPGNSSFTLADETTVSPLDTAISHVAFGAGVDAIGGGQLMYRVQWRDNAGTPTMVLNNTVNAGGGQAGIRWYILSKPGSNWTLAQEGTYAPDTADRWMGSIAMDGSGNVALGFSAAGGPSGLAPELHYAGRLAADAPGLMLQAEGTFKSSGGSQSHPSQRWGDYSQMTVDPVDNCTFWYTGEYYASSAINNWRTRIGSFSYGACGSTPGPTNTVPPAFSGSAIQGLTLNATFGTWSSAGGITGSAYQWRRCDGTTGLGCVDIPGATLSSYTVQAADIGSRIRVRTTATDATGSTPASSIATPVVVPQAPVNTAAPAVSGTVAVGNYLTVSKGTWTSSVPITYSYRWERCDSAGANCAPVTGVASQLYLLDNPDVGKRIRGVAIASNAGGAASANAAVTIVVPAPAAPTNSASPTVTGTAQAGHILTGSNGTWSGAGTLTFGSSWQRCDAAGGGCTTISGATSGAYLLSGADVDSTIRYVASATNGGGTTTSSSLPTLVVTAPISSGSGGSGGSGSGGSGGGGGGAAPKPDWVVTLGASPTPKQIGDIFAYIVTITNKGGDSSKAFVDITLPSQTSLVGSSVERGSGCTGTTTLSCNLDFLPAALTTRVVVTAKVNAVGTLTATANGHALESDLQPADNTATVTLAIGATTEPQGVPGGLNGGAGSPAGADKVKPSARALLSRVSNGKRSALRFKLYDDRGVAKATATVKRNGKVVATLKSGYGPVVYGTIYYLPWKVPAKLTTGGLSFCVVATDRSGNSSRPSCAPVSLR